MAPWRSLTKIAGSGSASGSMSQRYWSADPDPYQNVMDPQHWFPWRRARSKVWTRNPSPPFKFPLRPTLLHAFPKPRSNKLVHLTQIKIPSHCQKNYKVSWPVCHPPGAAWRARTVLPCPGSAAAESGSSSPRTCFHVPATTGINAQKLKIEINTVPIVLINVGPSGNIKALNSNLDPY